MTMTMTTSIKTRLAALAVAVVLALAAARCDREVTIGVDPGLPGDASADAADAGAGS